MGRAKKFTEAEMATIAQEKKDNGWTLEETAKKNSVNPNVNHVTIYNNLIKYGHLVPKTRKVKEAVVTEV